MSWAEAMLLAVVQGLTEFLPVSSSGHLAILGDFLSESGEVDLAYVVLLHLGTLLAVVAYYRRDLARMALSLFNSGPEAAAARRLVWLLAAGTLPAAAAYLVAGDWIEASFNSLTVVGVGFLITGTVLYATHRLGRRGRPEAGMRWRDALGVGAAQGVALLPGISRSGSTIAAALSLGLDRELAVRYSFLLSIPAILGGNLVKARHLLAPGVPLTLYFAGAAVAAVVAYASIHVLLRIVRRGHLSYFAFYCWILGAGLLIQQWAAR
jgi:undecaprenyl-diphosphatase